MKVEISLFDKLGGFCCFFVEKQREKYNLIFTLRKWSEWGRRDEKFGEMEIGKRRFSRLL
jgi:hypothetical protein